VRRACEEPAAADRVQLRVPKAPSWWARSARTKNPNFGLQRSDRHLRRPGEVSGVIDPTKVTRTALQNAASIASLMLTTEAMVARFRRRSRLRPAAAATAARDGLLNPGGLHIVAVRQTSDHGLIDIRADVPNVTPPSLSALAGVGPKGIYRDPEFLRLFEERGHSVAIHEGGCDSAGFDSSQPNNL
jgi:hypothetical protein